ncbi:uncharacterized protein LOC113311017 [Papaver somniferum]|uniref:uncharacterized protein LOC113311017 n=1 Tax=Papaver somniferum TaxID=3469 RepID=UPI000E6FD2F1|nr:uncharacterized protein LOC113311017 [Papaver somniferum]XP_026415638.1 uncharacterized protein LOC113311017 [Papaver somniferum]XP_026415639.1 uncharacterized protein LOC113311017 [Papaver somniferum]
MEKKEKKKEGSDGKRYCMLDLLKDCIYRTLIKLDVESLQRSKFVCKAWYKMISNTIFIEDRLCRSEMGLIFLYKSSEKETSSNENVFHVEQHYLSRKTGINWMPRIDQYEAELNLRFMEIKDGKSTVRSLKLNTYGQIRAVCNGFLLLESKTKCGPIVINPVTREYTVLCRGTETLLPRFESYGLAFSHGTEEYKVVHLFRDDLQFFGCEIIVVGSHTWRAVDGPSSGLINQLGKAPIVAIGAFHWMPHIENSDYIVSMGIDDEKFRKIKLPNPSGKFDGLVDMGGCLSFLNQVSLNQLDVWILEDLHGSKWTLKHKITVGSTICMVPVGYNSRNNELVLKKGPSLGTYDFEQRQMKWIEGCSPYMESYMPHFNSLVSWRNRRDQRLEDV